MKPPSPPSRNVTTVEPDDLDDRGIYQGKRVRVVAVRDLDAKRYTLRPDQLSELAPDDPVYVLTRDVWTLPAEEAERTAVCRCNGRGWSPVWVDDPNDPNGGYEDGECYCECPAGVALRERER